MIDPAKYAQWLVYLPRETIHGGCKGCARFYPYNEYVDGRFDGLFQHVSGHMSNMLGNYDFLNLVLTYYPVDGIGVVRKWSDVAHAKKRSKRQLAENIQKFIERIRDV